MVFNSFNERHSVCVFLIERLVEQDETGNVVEGVFSGGEEQLPVLTPVFFVVRDANFGQSFPHRHCIRTEFRSDSQVYSSTFFYYTLCLDKHK